MSDTLFTRIATHLNQLFDSNYLADLLVEEQGVRFIIEAHTGWELDKNVDLRKEHVFPGIGINLNSEEPSCLASEFLGISLQNHFDELRRKTIKPQNARLSSVETTIGKAEEALAPFFHELPYFIEVLHDAINDNGMRHLYPVVRRLESFERIEEQEETPIRLTYRYTPFDPKKAEMQKAIKYAQNAVVNASSKRSHWTFVFDCCVVEYAMDRKTNPPRMDILSLAPLKRMKHRHRSISVPSIYPGTIGVCYSRDDISSYSGRGIALSTLSSTTENDDNLRNLLEADFARPVISQQLTVSAVESCFCPLIKALTEVRDLLGYYTGGGSTRIVDIKGHNQVERSWLEQARSQADDLLKHFEKKGNTFSLWRPLRS